VRFWVCLLLSWLFLDALLPAVWIPTLATGLHIHTVSSCSGGYFDDIESLLGSVHRIGQQERCLYIFWDSNDISTDAKFESDLCFHLDLSRIFVRAHGLCWFLGTLDLSTSA